jgi:hypothetical protein
MPRTTVTCQHGGAIDTLNMLSTRRSTANSQHAGPSNSRSPDDLSCTASENPPQAHIDEDYDHDNNGSDDNDSGDNDGHPHAPPPPPSGPPGGNQHPQFPELVQAITLLTGNHQQQAQTNAKTKLCEHDQLDRWLGSEFGERVLTVPPSYGRTHEAISEIPEIAGVNAYTSIVPHRTSWLLPSHHNMADIRANTIEELDEEEHAGVAVLEVIRQRKAKVQEEVEEKWRAEEAKTKRKAEEAEREQQAEEAQKAEETRVAKAKAKAEEAEKIWAANKAMQDGLVVHEAEKRRVAEEATRLKAAAIAKHQELAKLGVAPDNPLMQAPEGPGSSHQELQEIQRSFRLSRTNGSSGRLRIQ